MHDGPRRIDIPGATLRMQQVPLTVRFLDDKERHCQPQEKTQVSLTRPFEHLLSLPHYCWPSGFMQQFSKRDAALLQLFYTSTLFVCSCNLFSNALNQNEKDFQPEGDQEELQIKMLSSLCALYNPLHAAGPYRVQGNV